MKYEKLQKFFLIGEKLYKFFLNRAFWIFVFVLNLCASAAALVYLTFAALHPGAIYIVVNNLFDVLNESALLYCLNLSKLLY